MARIGVVGEFAGLYEKARYLEIGVQDGNTFSSVVASHKVAVDPEFRFDVDEYSSRPENAHAVLHPVPSDEYFGTILKADQKFDLIFIDGLHTFDQTLRDLLNATECLAPGGTIIVDDVMPSSYGASLPLDLFYDFHTARGMVAHDWMGDVFRLVYFIRDYLRGFSYATVQETHGMTVLWREPRPTAPAPLDIAAIAQIGYAEAVISRDVFNLLPQDEIVSRLRHHIASAAAT